MADEETQEDAAVKVDKETEKRLNWNMDMFVQLGYQPEIAELLATEKVDWHEAKRMIDRGASLNQVLRVLL